MFTFLSFFKKSFLIGLLSCDLTLAELFEQTRGLKHGRAIVVSTCAAVASILTGVLAGMLALGEDMPSAPLARLSLLLGWYSTTSSLNFTSLTLRSILFLFLDYSKHPMHYFFHKDQNY